MKQFQKEENIALSARKDMKESIVSIGRKRGVLSVLDMPKTTKKNSTPLEEDECILLKHYLDDLIDRKKLQMYTHIPNETYTASWSVKKKNKAMGVSRGVPDYMLLTFKEIVFIEMKRQEGGVVSPQQLSWIQALAGLGYKVKVCKGFNKAKEYLQTL